MNAADRYAHANPAICAACLRWIAEGYEDAADGRVDAPRHVALVWAMLALGLLLPREVRDVLPSRSTKRLVNLVAENPMWRASLPDAARFAKDAYWSGVSLAVATGVLGIEHGRLVVRGKMSRPDISDIADLRTKSITFGKMLANEGVDEAVGLALGIWVDA